MGKVNNVSVGKPNSTGAVYAALTGTELPTTAAATLDAGFSDLGYVSEDGVTNSRSPEVEEIKAWGGDVVAVPQSSITDTFAFTLIESLNDGVLSVVYGEDNVNVDGTKISVNANRTEADERSFVIDMILTGEKLKRIVIPNGKITEIGDITYQDGEVIGYELTITCMPDDAENTHYEYIAEQSTETDAQTASDTETTGE